MKAVILSIFVACQFLATVQGQNCQHWGFTCKDCKTPATCVNVQGEWKAVELRKCNDAEYCNRAIRNCSVVKDCEDVKNPPFQCNTPGIFPDPYDCKKYHACILNKKTSELMDGEIQCSQRFGFSPEYNECSVSTTHLFCRSRQYSCTTIGEMAAWKPNFNIFYICLKVSGYSELHPFLYRCESGDVFANGECRPENDDSAKSASPLASCENPGEFIEHLTDCEKYYLCNSQLKQVLLKCPQGSFFNITTNRCVPGNC